MPYNKINKWLVLVFFTTTILGDIYNLPYCLFVSQFLWLLFSTALQRSYIQKKQVELKIIKASESSICITKKQHLLLYATSAMIGSILNVVAVFFSMPYYIMFGIDFVIIAICIVIHHKMQPSPSEEKQS